MPRGRGGFGPSRGPRGRGGRRNGWGSWIVLALLAGGAGYWWYSFKGHAASTTQPGEVVSTAPEAGAGTKNTEVTAAPGPDETPTSPKHDTPETIKPNSTADPKASDVAPEHAHVAAVVVGPTTTAATAALLAEGMKLVEDGKMVQGRKALSRLLAAGVWEDPQAAPAPTTEAAEAHAETLSGDDAQAIRDTLTSINRTLIFSPKFVKDDSLTEIRTVAPGDVLLKIVPPYSVPYQAIEFINNTAASRIRVGQRLKMVHGPFHAVISEREYRMDIWIKDPADGAMIYVRSFRVGLGEAGSTPSGSWIIKRGGKIANPQWSNPKTGEFFKPGDPNIPIGKFWLALEGTDEFTKTKKGFGIHGTNDPSSIGRQASMGCVHLADDDIALVYRLLSDGLSTVLILP